VEEDGGMNMSLLIAFKGPNQAIENAITIGNGCALFALMSMIWLAMRHKRRRCPESLFGIGVFLLIAHPAWTISARSGDGGDLKIIASLFVSVLYLFIIVASLISRPR
jgi:hypothetical protein